MAFIDDSQVLQVLRGLNPWWASNHVPDILARPVKRLAFFEADRWLQQKDLRRAIILSGARRVGKTTILYQLAQKSIAEGISPDHVMYASFDHPILKVMPLQQVVDIFINNVSADPKGLVLLLDEIHYASDWSLWLKRLVDENPTVRIVCTGSASVELGAGGVESGVGRWVDVKIPTLSFYEYVRLKAIPVPEITQSVRPNDLPNLSPSDRNRTLTRLAGLEPHFHRYLLTGGFPETAQMEDLSLAQRLLRDDVVDRVLKRDMTALYNVNNVLDLERLFIYLCLNSGGIIVQDKLAQDLGVSRSTVANYLRYLEMANLIYRLDPLGVTGKKVLRPRPKVYLADSALRNAVLLRGHDVLTDSTEMGLIVETAVIKHLRAYYYPERAEIGYWRGDKEKEIDIVVRRPGGWELLVEVKYRNEPKLPRDAGLYVRTAQSAPAAALVVTKSATDFGPMEKGQGITPFQVPAFVFLYLLGHAEHVGYL